MSLDYERLAHLPALAGFTPEEIDAFFAISTRLVAKAGDRIIRTGDAADSFFILAKGGLEVVVEANGHPMPVARLGRGHLVGEMPLIYHQPVRQADVVALDECHLFRWLYSEYEALGQRQPALIKKFRANLGKIAAARSWTATPGAPPATSQPPASQRTTSPHPTPSPGPGTPPSSAGAPPHSPAQPGPLGRQAGSANLPLRALGGVESKPAEETSHAVLKRATTFMGFTDEEVRQIEAIATPIRVTSGLAVCQAGDPADSFFVVTAGQVEVQITKNDAAFPLARLGPGQVFGEMALVYKQPTRSATVVAAEPSRLLRIAFEDYNRLVQGLPDIGRKLKNNLSRVAASRAWSLPKTDEAQALKKHSEKP